MPVQAISITNEYCYSHAPLTTPPVLWSPNTNQKMFLSVLEWEDDAQFWQLVAGDKERQGTPHQLGFIASSALLRFVWIQQKFCRDKSKVFQENERFFRQIVSNTENISVRGTPGRNCSNGEIIRESLFFHSWPSQSGWEEATVRRGITTHRDCYWNIGPAITMKLNNKIFSFIFFSKSHFLMKTSTLKKLWKVINGKRNRLMRIQGRVI